MAGAKKTVWDLALEITGQDKGAKAALASIKANIKDVQDAGKKLSKDFQAFTGNASKLALGVAAGVAAAGVGVISLANSFATAGDQVAKTADSLGMAIEGYQKLKYAMDDSGVEAGEFDSAIQKMTNTINQGAAGNEAARKQLEGIGLDAKKLAGMRPEQAFERIADYMQTLPNDAARANVAITLFGKTAGPKMAQAMKIGSAGIQALGAEAESLGVIFSESQARASEEYGDQLARLGQAVTGMKNQFIGGAIGPLTEAFKTLKGALQDQMPAIQELGAKFGQWLGDMVARLPEIIARIKEVATNVWDNVTKVKDFVGGWKNLAVIIGVLVSLKTALSGIKVIISAVTYAQTAYNAVLNITKSAIVAYKAAQAAAAAAGKGMIVVQRALNVAMAANTIGLIIAGIVALIALIVLLVKNFDKIKEVAGKVWGAVKEGATKAWNKVKEGASAAWEGIKTGASKVGGFLKKNWKSVALGMVSPMAGGFKLLYDNCEGFRNVVDKVSGFVKDIFAKMFNFLNDLTGGALGRVVDKIKQFIDSVKNFFTGLWGALKAGPKATIEFLGNAFGNLWNGIVNIASKAWEGIKTGANAVGGFFVNVWNDIKNAGGQVFNFLDNFSGGALTKIKDNFLDSVNNIKAFFTGLWRSIKEGPEATIEYLKNAFFGLFDKIKENVLGFVNFFKEKMEAVKNFFGGIGDKAGSFVGGAVDKFKSILPGHAEGGIFTHRHIAEIAERGAEAVVPLNNSPQGFDIWKQAGEMAGYMNKAAAQSAGGASNTETPPVMKAAASQITNTNGYTFNVDFNMTNNFSGSPDADAVGQIETAGRVAADDFTTRVRAALESIMRDQRRVSYA
jgi:phage-related protein